MDTKDSRPRLDVTALPADGGAAALYSLSKEGVGSTGALTGALTTTLLIEAERRGQLSPTGRVALPVVAVLYEVANVCRWADLPDKYSDGSRGIICACYLQSWSQGVECWGRKGVRKLWGAANIRVYGGGTHAAEFLEDVSRICGEWDAPSTSPSTSRGTGRTFTSATRRDPYPRRFDFGGPAVVPGHGLPSGTYPLVVRKVAWHHTKRHR